MLPKILNAAGDEIVLTQREQMLCDVNQRLVNSLGFEIPITTMTQIQKKISEQLFYEVRPSLYLPVAVGNGAWSTSIETFRSYEAGSSFEDGFLNTGGDDAELSQADVGVDSVNVKTRAWAKGISWNFVQLQQAIRAGNWDLVTAKEKSRKRNWDLGVQKIAFLGANTDSKCLGLLTQSGILTDTALLATPISNMTPEDLAKLPALILNRYRTNANHACWPTHFVLPETDFIGTAQPSSPQFPIAGSSKMEILLQTFKVMTGNPNFKILPLSYADAVNNAQAQNNANKQIYALYQSEEESLRMDICVDYTNTLAQGSPDGFNFRNVGYGQLTGVVAYRPTTMMYFTSTTVAS